MKIKLLVGNTATGKTEFALHLARKGDFILSRELMHYAVRGGNSGRSYNWEEFFKPVVKQALGTGNSVVVDDYFPTHISRYQWSLTARHFNVPFEIYQFHNVSMDVAIRRCPDRTLKELTDSFNVFEDTFEVVEDNEADKFITVPLEFNFKAVDFDGTIVEHKYPNLLDIKPSDINWRMVEFMHEWWQDDFTRIIIHTCRTGHYKTWMRDFLEEHRIPFDWINENPLEPFFSREKLFAHEYWDDAAKIPPQSGLK